VVIPIYTTFSGHKNRFEAVSQNPVRNNVHIKLNK